MSQALQTPDPQMVRRRLRRAAFITSGAGAGFGVLAIISWFLLTTDQQAAAAAADPWDYYMESGFSGSTIAGLYLLPFAAISFLWFIVALRGWIRGTRRRRNELISDLQLVSGVAFAAVFLVGGGAVATATIAGPSEDGVIAFETLRALAAFGSSLMEVMGVRMAAMFVLATASQGMSTKVLPRWFNLLGIGFGLVLMLAPIVDGTFFLAFPVWVIVLAVLLLWHVVKLPEEELPGFAARYAQDEELGELEFKD